MGLFKQSITRRYYKVQNMLADLGGLLKALITIAFHLNFYFSDKTYYNRIIDANINSMYIKSIRESVLVECVGAKEKNKDQNYPVPQDDVKKDEKVNGDNIENDLEKGSPRKFLNISKSMVSDIGQQIEMIPVKDDLTQRSDLKSVSNNNLQLSKVPDSDKPKEDQIKEAPSTMELKKKRSVPFKAFQIDIAGYLLPMCCFNPNSRTGRQLQLHCKLSKIINEQLDILNITRKFHTVDKINYILCGQKYKNLLETTINPYLQEDSMLPTSDIHEARKEIITSFKMGDN
jgi:hypothetical protein